MTAINDAIHAVVGPGDLNDGLIVYYNSNIGAEPPGLSLNDAEDAFLQFQGGIKASLNDMWENFLTTAPQSLSGSVPDMKLEWWASGAPLV